MLRSYLFFFVLLATLMLIHAAPVLEDDVDSTSTETQAATTKEAQKALEKQAKAEARKQAKADKAAQELAKQKQKTLDKAVPKGKDILTSAEHMVQSVTDAFGQ